MLMKGTATTTRYWDCSGGSCGCGFGAKDHEVYCHSNALFRAPSGNQWGAEFYGSAALSYKLGGEGWIGSGCGKCFKVTGRSNIKGVNKTTTLVLKGTNSCPPSNPSCNNQAHFDIAAPGFDFPSASLSNTCNETESEPALHKPQTCAYWMIHSADASKNCDCSRF